MVGFNVRAPSNDAPFQMLTPEVLAQLAAAGFRPPGAGGGSGLPGGAGRLGSSGGGNSGLGAGMGMLGAGLGALGRSGTITNAGPQGSGPGGTYTTADALDMSGMGGDPSRPNYGVPSGLGKLAGAAKSGGFMDWLSGLFGSGGSAAGGVASGLGDMFSGTGMTYQKGGMVPKRQHFAWGGMAAPDIRPIDWGGGQAFDPYDPMASAWGAFDNDNPELEDNQGEGIGRGVGGTAGGLIGSIWGPIGAMAGREIGQKVGGGIGAAVQGDWGGAAESLVEGTPLDFIFNQGGAVPGFNMVPPEASPSRGAQTDDVTAQVSVGEFVMPHDVTAWVGEKHMQGMIDAARAEMANRTAAPEMKPVETPAAAPTFLSEGAAAKRKPPLFSVGT